MLEIVFSKVINSKIITKTRCNNNVVFQIAQNPKFDLFKVQASKPKVRNSKPITTAI